MIQNDTQAIILAAGKATRFRTGKTKLLEKICGQEMILYPAKLFETMKIATIFVVGYQKELIQEKINEHHKGTVSFVTQEIQRGTGHAILSSKETWTQENILICNGDCPLITQEIIDELYTQHKETNAAISFVVAHNADPSLGGYGRIVKQENSMKIVEAKDFVGDVNTHCCINAGIYLVKKSFLQSYIEQIDSNNKSNEFYFTDIIELASINQQVVTTVTASFDQIRGINTLQELWIAEQIKRAELIKYWMGNGVQFSIAQNVHIDLTVSIDSGSRIGGGVHLLGNTKIGKNCDIQEFSSIENSTLDDDVTVYSHCIIKNAHLEDGAQVGPFAHVRNNSHIGKNAIVGNFVEIKNSTIGENTKAKHLTYLGDAQIGSQVIIGAGTITCNYDGVQTNTTHIKDNVFIGSNCSLIAPVTIESQVIIGAGSTITHNVPENNLAIARARQVNKEGYAAKIKAKKALSNQQEVQHEVQQTNHVNQIRKQQEEQVSFSGAITTDTMHIPENHF